MPRFSLPQLFALRHYLIKYSEHFEFPGVPICEFRWLHLPHLDGFKSFNGWLHEIVGHWVYNMRGWL